VAAQFLVDTGTTAFFASSKPIRNPLDFLDHILRSAHEQIVAFGQRQNPPIDPRSTAVAVLIQGGYAYWSHAGDSRMYLLRSGRVSRRTRDHSLLEQMRRHGLSEKSGKAGRRYRNLVTQCLGGAGAHFGTTRGRPTELHPGDLLILCTDGLWSQFPDQRLLAITGGERPLQKVVDAMAATAAQAAAPASDNVTLLALRCLADAAPQDPAPAPDSTRAAAAPDRDEDELRAAIDLLRGAIEDFESKQ
jgi:serine/threonine protein phosphatase PrpC